MLSDIPTALIATAPLLVIRHVEDLLRRHWPRIVLTHTAVMQRATELVFQSTYNLVVVDAALPGQALHDLLGKLCHERPNQGLLLLMEAESDRQPAFASVMESCLQVPRYLPQASLIATLERWLGVPNPSMCGAGGTARRAKVPFTSRELEVLRCIAADQSNEDIANSLFISVRTVESHRRTLLQKTDRRTVAGLVAQALRQGWID